MIWPLSHCMTAIAAAAMIEVELWQSSSSTTTSAVYPVRNQAGFSADRRAKPSTSAAPSEFFW